jgi:hypothetical protein
VRNLPPAFVELVRFTENFWPHAAAFARHQTNLGRALYREPAGGENDPPIEQTLGYCPESKAMSNPAELRKFENSLAEVKNPTRITHDPLGEKAFSQLLARVRRKKLTPICFLTPTVRHGDFFAPRPPNERIFAFTDPTEFAQFYQPALRIDFDHLNDAGALEFTRLFANRFADFLEEKSLPSHIGATLEQRNEKRDVTAAVQDPR